MRTQLPTATGALSQHSVYHTTPHHKAKGSQIARAATTFSSVQLAEGPRHRLDGAEYNWISSRTGVWSGGFQTQRPWFRTRMRGLDWVVGVTRVAVYPMRNSTYGLVTTTFRIINRLSLPDRRATTSSSTVFSLVQFSLAEG